MEHYFTMKNSYFVLKLLESLSLHTDKYKLRITLKKNFPVNPYSPKRRILRRLKNESVCRDDV